MPNASRGSFAESGPLPEHRIFMPALPNRSLPPRAPRAIPPRRPQSATGRRRAPGAAPTTPSHASRPRRAPSRVGSSATLPRRRSSPSISRLKRSAPAQAIIAHCRCRGTGVLRRAGLVGHPQRTPHRLIGRNPPAGDDQGRRAVRPLIARLVRSTRQSTTACWNEAAKSASAKRPLSFARTPRA